MATPDSQAGRHIHTQRPHTRMTEFSRTRSSESESISTFTSAAERRRAGEHKERRVAHFMHGGALFRTFDPGGRAKGKKKRRKLLHAAKNVRREGGGRLCKQASKQAAPNGTIWGVT